MTDDLHDELDEKPGIWSETPEGQTETIVRRAMDEALDIAVWYDTLRNRCDITLTLSLTSITRRIIQDLRNNFGPDLTGQVSVNLNQRTYVLTGETP